MALSNFSASEQRIIKLLSATLNAAPTPDLLEELATYADAGVSAEVLLGVAFNNSVVAAKYPALPDGGDTAAFLSTFVENATAGAGITPAVKAQWKAALQSDYDAYQEAAGDDATDAGFAIWLLDILATAAFPAGSDLAKVQANLVARAEAAGTDIAASTQTYDPAKGWAQFEIGNPGGIKGDDIDLEVGREVLTGTADNDTFWADLVGNLNTLESGDRLDGGNGIDTLVAQIGNSQDFAINPTLVNIEKVLLSAQTTTADHSDNNIGSPVLLEEIGQLLNSLVDGLTGGFDPEAQAALLAKLNGLLEANWRGAQFDGGSRGAADNQRGTVGVNHWESNNSRADLIVEDVRILDSQITKDITVAFVESDPGNVDFGLYFDQHSLRKESGTQTTALTLTVYNPLAVSDGFDPANPLENVPYDQLTINVNGNPITVSFDLTGVTTYDEFYAALVESFTEAFDTYPELAGGSIVRLPDSKSFFSVDGQLRTADEFVLTLPNNTLTPANPGWNASQGLPPDNAFAANVQQGTPVVTENLITSTIILDDVGRGSTGGDLVIGGMSTGETSESKGVEQFDITVERSSKLQSIASTNNTLEVVNIKSGAQYNEVKNGSWTGNKYGDLTVLGSVDVTGYGSYLNKYVNLATGDIGLPGAVVEEATGFGLVDVREVDASEFQGNLSLSVLLTNRVAEKYLDLKDDPFNPAEDDVEFEYTLGSGNDVFALEIAKDNFATGGTTVYNDFDLVIDGGAGNDTIMARVGSEGEGALDLANWYLNSKLNANLAIAAGAGDDVVRTEESGDWFVDLGAGNDTYYADNSGDKALWVFNGVYNGGNIASAVNNNATVVSGTFTVTATRANGEVFTATVDVEHAAGKINDLHINQVIKDGINNDPVLGKLLEASDGPAFALVVKSLIDGEWTDVSFAFAGNTLDTADLTAYNRANNSALTLAELQAAQDAFATGFGGAGDYLAANPAGDLAGTDSLNSADNTVNGGAGNDVIVLGTGAVSSDVVVYTGLNNGVDTIVNFIAGADGVTEYTADTEGNSVRGTDVAGTNVDVIDLVSYNAVQAPIDGTDDSIADTIAALDGSAAGNYIVIKDIAAIVATDGYTAESLKGEYLVEIYSVNAAGDATRTGTIAELDFNGAVSHADLDLSIFWTA